MLAVGSLDSDPYTKTGCYMKPVKVFLLLVLASYFAINLLVYANQRELMFVPTPDHVTPEEVGLADVDEVTLVLESKLELNSWFGRAKNGQPTILFFHGNAGAVNHRAHRFRELMAEGYGVFILGYPGYGGNEGSPSEKSFREASLLSYEYLRNLGLDAEDVVIYGESIGTGVAVQLAAHVEAKALILESPMTSAIDVASEHYPYLPVSLLLKDRFKSDDHIDRIEMPLLVMHGDRDTIIPIKIGQELFALAKEPKSFVTLEGAGHNDLQLYPVKEIAREFIDSL